MGLSDRNQRDSAFCFLIISTPAASPNQPQFMPALLPSLSLSFAFFFSGLFLRGSTFPPPFVASHIHTNDANLRAKGSTIPFGAQCYLCPVRGTPVLFTRPAFVTFRYVLQLVLPLRFRWFLFASLLVFLPSISPKTRGSFCI